MTNEIPPIWMWPYYYVKKYWIHIAVASITLWLAAWLGSVYG